MKNWCLLVGVAVLAACKPPEAANKVEVHISIENKSTKKIVGSWVDGGATEKDFGVLIIDGRATYLFFAAKADAPLGFKWQFENESAIHSATNLLGRGLQNNEEIVITVTDDKASARLVKSSD